MLRRERELAQSVQYNVRLSSDYYAIKREIMQKQKPVKNNLIKIMQTTLFALCLFFVGLQVSHAQAKLPNSATATFTKEEQEILDLSKTKWTWMSDKNTEALDGLFKENCVFVHMGGSWGRNRS